MKSRPLTPDSWLDVLKIAWRWKRCARPDRSGTRCCVRALFGDCPHETLDRVAARVGRTPAQLMEAYGTAKVKHAAANPEMDAGG